MKPKTRVVSKKVSAKKSRATRTSCYTKNSNGVTTESVGHLAGSSIKKPAMKVRMDDAGRILVPAKFRKKLGIKPGASLTVSIDNDNILRVGTLQSDLASARKMMRKRVAKNANLSDELIVDRRSEAASE